LGSAAFARGWDVTLVILAAIPILGVVIGSITYFTNKITSEQSDSYGVANGIASEALAAIRTVLSFNGEERTVRRYGMSLTRPMQVGIRAGALNGLTIGSAQCFFICGYALALWYGGIRVRAGKYTGVEFSLLLVSRVIKHILRHMAVGDASNLDCAVCGECCIECVQGVCVSCTCCMACGSFCMKGTWTSLMGS